MYFIRFVYIIHAVNNIIVTGAEGRDEKNNNYNKRKRVIFMKHSKTSNVQVRVYKPLTFIFIVKPIYI